MRYLLIAVLLLPGCAIHDLQDDMRLSRYSSQCAKIGHAAGSPEFRDCQTQLMSRR